MSGTSQLNRTQKYQSHKGWTSNSNNMNWKDVVALYQSHKGWTSNLIKRFNINYPIMVSIPQGVDVKHAGLSSRTHTWKVSIPQGVDVKRIPTV